MNMFDRTLRYYTLQLVRTGWRPINYVEKRKKKTIQFPLFRNTQTIIMQFLGTIIELISLMLLRHYVQ